jgi:hypothetical protein
MGKPFCRAGMLQRYGELLESAALLFLALCVCHQLISLEIMETLGDDQRLHEVSEHMQHNLFYESARMDLIERMCKSFRPTINSRR